MACSFFQRRKMLFVCLRPQAGNKHRAGVIGLLEAAMFVEGEFPADALALVFDAHLNFVSKLS